jgi:hypothetical protein
LAQIYFNNIKKNIASLTIVELWSQSIEEEAERENERFPGAFALLPLSVM